MASKKKPTPLPPENAHKFLNPARKVQTRKIFLDIFGFKCVLGHFESISENNFLSNLDQITKLPKKIYVPKSKTLNEEKNFSRFRSQICVTQC